MLLHDLGLTEKYPVSIYVIKAFLFYSSFDFSFYLFYSSFYSSFFISGVSHVRFVVGSFK